MSKTKKIVFMGALLGVLAIASALATTFLLGRTIYLGTSTSFVRAAGFIERFFSPELTAQIAHYSSIGIRVDWQFMLVIGIVIGSFISAVTSRSFKVEFIPPIWRERFGNSIIKRGIFAFFGGILTIYGARLADGCTSGHGLSGLMQLSFSSLIALCLFFIVGIITARIVYTK